MALIASKRRTLVEIVTVVPTPAALARAITASRSASKSGKSRWQWLSTSISRRASAFASVLGFHVARKHSRGRRQGRSGRKPAGTAESIEKACLVRHREKVEEPGCRAGHHRLDQDRDLTDDLRGDVEDGA